MLWSLKTAWGNFHSTLRGTHNLVLFPSEVLNEKLCEHPCTSISKVLSLRTSHESSSPLWKCILSAFSGYNLHTHILPQSHIRGCYPSRAVNELILSLNQITIHLLRCGGSSITLLEIPLDKKTVLMKLSLGPKN